MGNRVKEENTSKGLRYHSDLACVTLWQCTQLTVLLIFFKQSLKPKFLCKNSQCLNVVQKKCDSNKTYGGVGFGSQASTF